MLRIIYSIIRNLIHLYMIPMIRYCGAHPDKYSEEERYQLAKRLSRYVTKAGHIHTYYYGIDNLPKEGNYILCSNHQGKFDVLAIINGHQKPCSFVMDYNRSKMYVVNEIVNLLQGMRLKRDDIRQAMQVILELSEALKNGRRFIIFPEGGYLKEKMNSIYPFKSGCFKSVQRAKSTIVPVVLIDTYKAYHSNSLRRVYNEVHYLKPIPYEEIAELKTVEIANLVQQQIINKIAEITGQTQEEILVTLDPDVELI